MKNRILLAIFSMVSAISFAQQPTLGNDTKPTPLATDKPLDGYYKKNNNHGSESYALC